MLPDLRGRIALSPYQFFGLSVIKAGMYLPNRIKKIRSKKTLLINWSKYFNQRSIFVKRSLWYVKLLHIVAD